MALNHRKFIYYRRAFINLYWVGGEVHVLKIRFGFVSSLPLSSYFPSLSLLGDLFTALCLMDSSVYSLCLSGGGRGKARTKMQ